MKPVDTTSITEAAAAAVAGLPHDKRLHFSGSYVLCTWAEPFEKLENTKDCISSFSMVKEALDVFSIGLSKEFADKGADGAEAAAQLLEAARCVGRARELALKAGLDVDAHETDLLADVAGIGLFLLTQGIQKINFRIGEFE